jgi:DNA-binding MarR family transcriptional regulator
LRTISKPGRGLDADARALRERLATLSRLRAIRDPLVLTSEKAGLTPSQIHTLLWLGMDGPLTMGEIARRLGVTEKTVTGVVDRLERDGWVRRERAAADRRVVHVRLTTKGEAMSARMDAAVLLKLKALLHLLDATDRRALLRIIDRFTAAFMAPPEGSRQ